MSSVIVDVQDKSQQVHLTGDKDDDHILQWAVETFRDSRNQHEQNWCRDHFIYYQHFRNFVNADIDPDDFHSQFGLGIAFPIVKIISSTLMGPWQAGDSFMDATAMSEPGIPAQGEIAGWVNHKLVNGIPRSFSKLELCKESAIAFGRGIVKPCVRWQPQMSMLKRFQVTLGQALGFGGVNRTGLRYEQVPPTKRLDLEYVDPFNWWMLGSTRWAEECDATFERGYLTHSAVWRKMQSGEWKAYNIEPGSGLGYDQYTQRRLELDGGGGGDQVRSGNTRQQPHAWFETQGWVETNKTKDGMKVYENRRVTVLDEKYLVKNVLLDSWNGRPEYIVFEPQMDPGNTRPIGVIEPMEQALLALNDFINIGMDNARYSIESPIAIDPDAMEDTEIYWGPKEVNKIRDPRNAMVDMPNKDLPRSFFELIGFFNDVVQRITGVSDYFGGMNTSDTARLTKTARGMEQMQNLATKRFAPILRKMDFELYRPIAVWMHETAKLRNTESESVPMPNNTQSPFAEITPEMLALPFKFSFNVRALDAASGRRRQDFVEMMGMLNDLATSGQLGQQGYYIDMMEAARLLLGEFDRERDADKLIKQIQQIPMPLAGPEPVQMPGAPSVPGTPMLPGGAPPPPRAPLPEAA